MSVTGDFDQFAAVHHACLFPVDRFGNLEHGVLYLSIYLGIMIYRQTMAASELNAKGLSEFALLRKPELQSTLGLVMRCRLAEHHHAAGTHSTIGMTIPMY